MSNLQEEINEDLSVSKEEISNIIKEINEDSVDYFIKYFVHGRNYLYSYKRRIENIRRYYEGHVIDEFETDIRDFFEINLYVYEYIYKHQTEIEKFICQEYECASRERLNLKQNFAKFLEFIEKYFSFTDMVDNDDFSKFLLSLVEKKFASTILFKTKKHLLCAEKSKRDKRSIKDFAKILTIFVLDAYSYQHILNDQEPVMQMNIFVCKVEQSVADHDIIYNIQQKENNFDNRENEKFATIEVFFIKNNTDHPQNKLIRNYLKINKKRKHFYSVNANLETSTFTAWFTFFLSFFSIYDLYADVRTAIQFYQQDQMEYFWATVIILYAAGLLNVIAERKLIGRHKNFTEKLKLLNIPAIYVWICILQFSIFFRNLQILILFYNKSSNKLERYLEILVNGAIESSAKDKARITFIETCCEAIPQTILQVYIVLVTNHATFIQCRSIATSSISILINAIGFIGSVEGFTTWTFIKNIPTNRNKLPLIFRELCFYGLRILSTSFLLYHFPIMYVLIGITGRFLIGIAIETIWTTACNNLSLIINLVSDHFKDKIYNVISLLEFICYFLIYLWNIYGQQHHIEGTYFLYLFCTYAVLLLLWTFLVFNKCKINKKDRKRKDDNEQNDQAYELEMNTEDKWSKDTIRNWCYVYEYNNLKVTDFADFFHISNHVFQHLEHDGNNKSSVQYAKNNNNKYTFLKNIVSQFTSSEPNCNNSHCQIKTTLDKNLVQNDLVSIMLSEPDYTVTLTDDSPQIKVKIYVNEQTLSRFTSGYFINISYIFTHEDNIINGCIQFKHIREILQLNTNDHFIYQDKIRVTSLYIKVINLFTCFLPLIDIIFDNILIYRFYYNVNMNLFWSLLGVLVVVGITNVFLERYYMHKILNTFKYLLPILNWPKIVPFLSFIQFFSILQNLNLIKLYLKSKNIIKDSYKLTISNSENQSFDNESYDMKQEILNRIEYGNQFKQLCILREMKFVESCFESVPQAAILLYTMLIWNDSNYFRLFSILFGILGAASAGYLYATTINIRLEGLPKQTILFLIQEYSFYASRTISFSLLVSQLPKFYVILWILTRISICVIMETIIISGNSRHFDFIKAIFSDLTDKCFYNVLTLIEFVFGAYFAGRILYLQEFNLLLEIMQYFFFVSTLIWCGIMCTFKFKSKIVAY